MATTAPQSAPPPSASFINMEDFDTAFPDPDVTESATQNAAGVRNQPLPFVYSTAASSNAAINNNAGSSEASSSSVTSSARDLGGLNWIGKLLEYQQAHPGTPAPSFTESTVPGYVPLFVCLVQIGERPEPFGSTGQPFSTKKTAKQHSCKLAIEWLIENGHMPSVDSVAFPKGHSGASLQPGAPGAAAAPAADVSVGEKVVQLALELLFNPPAYVMAADPAAPMLWSGYAHFPGDPRVDGRVGEFSNVFGKKNAKDACAVQVVEFLQGVKRHRESTAMES